MPLNSGKYSLQQHFALMQVSGILCCYSLKRKLLGHKLQDSQDSQRGKNVEFFCRKRKGGKERKIFKKNIF